MLAHLPTWTTVRQEMLAELRAGDNLNLEVEVFLQEGDVDNALSTLSQMAYVDPALLPHVAEAAEAMSSEPIKTINVYSFFILVSPYQVILIAATMPSAPSSAIPAWLTGTVESIDFFTA